MELNLQSTKIELIQWLTTIENASVLQKIIEIRKRDNQDWRDAISTDEKESINEGIKDANSGRLKPNSEARAIYEKWL
jgi:hypothetical protein